MSPENSGFKRKKLETLALGERLKKMRNGKRISLNDLARSIAVRVEYLQALEEGKYSEMPADVYAKGFLRSYAAYFGAQPEPFLRLYDRERGIEQNILKKEKKTQHPLVRLKKLPVIVLTPTILVSFFALVLLSFGGYYLLAQYKNFVRDPLLVISEPENGTEVRDAFVWVRGRSDTDARIYINTQEVFANEDGFFEDSVPLQSGSNIIRIYATNRFDRETQREVFVEAKLPPVEQTPSFGGKVKIRVQGGETSVQVFDGDNEIVNRVFEDGNEIELSLSDNLNISAGNGSLVYVTLEGQGEFVLLEEEGAVNKRYFQEAN